MEFRKITEQEREMASLVQAQAFHRKYDTANPRSYKTCRATFDENGRMVACLELNDFRIWFDGHSVGMGGIGLVSSLPAFRRGGNVRGLFSFIFEEMYERGDLFSYLYPFSHEYYRKLGYEQCCRTIGVTLSLEDLMPFSRTGRAEQYLPGDNSEPIRNVYQSYACRHNMMVDRTVGQWQHRLDVNPYEKLVYSYVWYDENDRAVGYFQYTVGENKSSPQSIRIVDMAWQNHSGLLGMLGFMGRLFVISNMEKVSLTAGPEFQPEIIFPEPLKLEFKHLLLGMNRVINARRSLELVKKPSGEGSVVIQVKDENAPWNQNTWEVQWCEGESKVSPTSHPPDLVCSIQAISQLVTGYLPLEQLAVREDLEVINKFAELSRLFPSKKIMVSDFY